MEREKGKGKARHCLGERRRPKEQETKKKGKMDKASYVQRQRMRWWRGV
jgi:hypothetical protein